MQGVGVGRCRVRKQGLRSLRKAWLSRPSLQAEVLTGGLLQGVLMDC
jgi:hypothetical protein